MRQKGKSKVEKLEKKIRDIKRGKWRATEDELKHLEEELARMKGGR